MKDSTATHFAAYDGNGNIIALIKTDGTTSAEYDYGPFGETIRVSGSMGLSNPFRHSTKYSDVESGLIYYGLRYYIPDTGRWLSRDPIEEPGGINLYGFVENSPLTFIDAIGLCPCKCKKVKGGPANDRVLHKGSPPANNESALILIVPWEVEVEGDPAKCHCTYIDNGYIQFTAYFKNGTSAQKTQNFPRVETRVPCSNFSDLPGAYFPRTSPDFSFSIRFNLSVTFECEDEDKSGKISDTVNVNGLFLGTYPAVWNLPL